MSDARLTNECALTLHFGEMTAKVEVLSLGGDPIVVIDGGTDDEAILSMAEARALRDWLTKVIP